MSDTQSFWQWAADAAMAAVGLLGGLIVRDLKARLVKVEDSHKGLVTSDYLDAQMRLQTDERRWMHEQNAEAFRTLHERLDRVLDRE
jgi:hypothetical protein